jgi:hypothetical protein
MEVRGSLAAMAIAVGAMACAAPTADDGEVEPPAEEQPLDITVDAVEVVHGALRLSATMTDGAADVSVHLGAQCDRREIGGGVSTPSTLVWSLGEEDLAAAVRCGLQVRARGREGRRRVDRIADLPVTPSMDPADENAQDGPQIQWYAASDGGVLLVFVSTAPGDRLDTHDDALEATSDDGGVARFLMPEIDFARSLLRGDEAHVGGSTFEPALAVGGTYASLPGTDVPPVEVIAGAGGDAPQSEDDQEPESDPE